MSRHPREIEKRLIRAAKSESLECFRVRVVYSSNGDVTGEIVVGEPQQAMDEADRWLQDNA